MYTKDENKDSNTRYTCLDIDMMVPSILKPYSSSAIEEVGKQISAGKFMHRSDMDYKDAKSAEEAIKYFGVRGGHNVLIVSYVPIPHDPEHIKVTGFYEPRQEHHPLNIPIKLGHNDRDYQAPSAKRDDYPEGNKVEQPHPRLNPLKKDESKDNNTRYTCMMVIMKLPSLTALYKNFPTEEVNKHLSDGNFIHKSDYDFENLKDAQNAVRLLTVMDRLPLTCAYEAIPGDPAHIKITGFYDVNDDYHSFNRTVEKEHNPSLQKKASSQENKVERPHPSSKTIKPAMPQKADDVPPGRFFAASKSDTKKEESPSDEKGFRKGK